MKKKMYYVLCPNDLHNEFPYEGTGVYKNQSIHQMLSEQPFCADGVLKEDLKAIKGAWVIDAQTMKLINVIIKEADIGASNTVEESLNIVIRIIAKSFAVKFIKK